MAHATDDFNRANQELYDTAPPGTWSRMTVDGGTMLVFSNQVIGSVSNQSGAIRTGETYAGDHASSIEKTATALPGTGWIGPAVRIRNSGADMYLGIYYSSVPSFLLQLYKRVAGSSAGGFTQLTNTIGSNTIGLGTTEDPAGTVYKVEAVGSTITFSRNGTPMIVATDSTHAAGGAPGFMNWLAASSLDNWEGGDVGAATLSRSAALDAIGAVLAVGTKIGVRQRAAALDAVGAVLVSGSFFSVEQRAAALDAIAAIATGRLVEAHRSAALEAVGLVDVGRLVEANRAVALAAIASIDARGERVAPAILEWAIGRPPVIADDSVGSIANGDGGRVVGIAHEVDG